MARHTPEATIHCQQWRIQRFSQRQVACVICRRIRTQCPDPPEEEMVRISLDAERTERIQSLARTHRCQHTGVLVPAQHLHDLEIEQVRRMQRRTSEQPRFHRSRRIRLQQHLQQCGCVNDDQRASRSARTAAAGDSSGYTRDNSRTR